MSTSNVFPHPTQPFPKQGEPAWDLALMFPLQGGWTVDDYLALDTGLQVEFTDGFVRVLPMPNLLHQLIVKILFRQLDDFVSARRLGEVLHAPLAVQLASNKFREPDIVFLRPDRMRTLSGQPTGADLVVEVVSEGEENRRRDYVEKRREYAQAGIAEYWIVDPQVREIIVLSLAGHEYREHGTFGRGGTATSPTLEGFQIAVDAIFAKCDRAEQEALGHEK
jgi:Uma2 family endonuclease